jgi:hypothetical protein
MFYPYLIYIIFCVGFAYVNYIWIEKDNKHINHGWNGLAHIVIIACLSHYFGNWWLSLALPFAGKIFFDMPLNLFRGKSPFYMTDAPKAISDKIENFVFRKNGIAAKTTYFIISFVITVWLIL